MSSFGPKIRRLRVACLCCKLYSCKCDKFWGTCVHAGRRLRVRSSHELRACFFDIESNLCSLGWLVSVFQNSAPTGEGEDALRLCTASGQGVVDFSNRTDSCSRPPTHTHACTRNSSINSRACTHDSRMISSVHTWSCSIARRLTANSLPRLAPRVLA